MRRLLTTTAIAAGAIWFGTPGAQATPIETFQLNAGLVPGTSEGTVVVTGMGANEVDVLITLAPNLVINTSNGNSHTPVAFNLTGGLASLVNTGQGITVVQPVGAAACSPAPSPCFTPTFGPVPITGSVNLNEGLLYSGSNGGAGHGNDGPVEFTISATGIGAIVGGVFAAFGPGSNGAIFAVDMFISPNGPTGEQWATTGTCVDTANGNNACGGTTRGGGDPVPEPASLALLGVGLLGLGFVSAKRRHS